MNHHFSLFRIFLLCLSSLFFPSMATAKTQGGFSPLPLSKSYWKDEAFLKSFNASYRINARIEPTVGSKERGVLVSIQKLMAAGKRELALKKLQSSPLATSSAAILFNLGNIQFELGKLKDAAKSYQKAIKKLPAFRRAHRNLAYVFARQNHWKMALSELEEAIRLGDQDGSTYGQLAYGRLQQGQYVSALQAYRLAQITQPENIDWKAGIAQCLQNVNRNEEALALIDEVIKARPAEPSYYLLQASIQLSLNQTEQAITNLELVRRLQGGGATALDAENHLLLATLHLRFGSGHLARPLILKAFSMSPKPPYGSALNTLEFITQLRKWKLARDVADAIQSAYSPKEKDSLKRKERRLSALIDIDSKAAPIRGAKVLVALIKENPLDSASLILLAQYRASQQKLYEAEMLLQQAARIDGAEYQSRVELAKLYIVMKRYREAVKQLDNALKLNFSDSLQTYRQAVLHLAEAAE